MRLVVDGCDGVGKTTIAKMLCSNYGLDYAHCTNRDPTDWNFYSNIIRKDDILWDRHCVSELVYPRFFGREQLMSFQQVELLVAGSGAKFIIFSCPDDVLYDRLMRRGEEHVEVLDNFISINRMFCELGDRLGIPVVDTSSTGIDEIFSLVEGFDN